MIAVVVDYCLGRDARPRASAESGKANAQGSRADASARRPYLASRKETDRFKKFTYDEIVGSDTASRESAYDTAKPDRKARPALPGRDKANLEILAPASPPGLALPFGQPDSAALRLWLKDESLEDTENLPPPAELAAEIVESLEVALEEFRGVEDLLAEMP